MMRWYVEPVLLTASNRMEECFCPVLLSSK
jgi:hypothetical protein